MSQLEVRGLQAAYGPVRVLHGLDLEVEQGEVATVLGANGAGKTTLLRALSGVIGHSGSILFEGQPLPRTAERVLRRGIAHVPEGRGTFATLTVEENLRLGGYSRSDDEVAGGIAQAHEYFPVLRERRNERAGNLSGGEQQMLALGRALMSRPSMLLLDEPSLGLAPQVVRRVFDIVGRVNREQGTTIVVVEQNAQLALQLAHRAYVLEAGQVAASGPAAELSADPSIRRAYLGY